MKYQQIVAGVFVDEIDCVYRCHPSDEPYNEKRKAKARAELAARLRTSYRLKFWWWRFRLDCWGIRYGCRYRYTKSTGLCDSWFTYFEDGYSPRSALQEDWSYA
jgi:hypothetical protein